MVPSASIEPLTKLAFFDELEKIARTVRPDAQATHDKLKRWAKGTAIVAAGTGIGTGAFMLAERAAQKVLGSWWSRQSPNVQMQILSAVGSVATLGGAYLAKRLLEEKRKYEEG